METTMNARTCECHRLPVLRAQLHLAQAALEAVEHLPLEAEGALWSHILQRLADAARERPDVVQLLNRPLQPAGLQAVMAFAEGVLGPGLYRWARAHARQEEP